MARSGYSYSRSRNIFVAEKILDKKERSGITLYKVKWVGYPSNQCTWEPRTGLNRFLIKKFEKTISQGTSLLSSDTGKDSYVTEKKPKRTSTFKKDSVVATKKPTMKCESINYNNNESSQEINSTQRKTKTSKSLTFQNDNIIRRRSSRLSMPSTDNKATGSMQKIDNKNSLPTKPYTLRSSSVRKSEKMPIAEKVNKIKYNDKPLGEGVYEVEKIVDYDVRSDGVKIYKVRWLGYSPTFDTWETLDAFDDPNFVVKCEKSIVNKTLPSKSKRETRHKFMKRTKDKRFKKGRKIRRK